MSSEVFVLDIALQTTLEECLFFTPTNWSTMFLAVITLYSCSDVCVSVGRGVRSQPFTVSVGLQQECVLSPLLSIILYELERQSQPSRRGYNCWGL